MIERVRVLGGTPGAALLRTHDVRVVGQVHHQPKVLLLRDGTLHNGPHREVRGPPSGPLLLGRELIQPLEVLEQGRQEGRSLVREARRGLEGENRLADRLVDGQHLDTGGGYPFARWCE